MINEPDPAASCEVFWRHNKTIHSCLTDNLMMTSSAKKQSEPRKWTASPWLFPALLLIVSLALRLIYFWQYYNLSPYFNELALDELYHYQWAERLAAKGFYETEVFFRAPLYPYLLGFIYWLGGRIFTMRLVQLILGSFTPLLIYLLGKQLFNNKTASRVAVLSLFYPYFIFMEGELLIGGLLVALDLLLIILSIHALRNDRPYLWAGVGVLMGLSAIARPNILFFAPALFVYLFFHQRKKVPLRQRIKVLANLTAGCCLIVFSVTLHNYLVGNDFTLIAFQGGMSFYMGNNPLSDGQTAMIPGLKTEWQGTFDEHIKVAERELGHKLKPSEVSRFWYAKGRRYLWNNPAQAFKLYLRKFLLLINRYENSNNKTLAFVTRFTSLLNRLPLSLGLFLPFALLRIGQFGRQSPAERLVTIFVLSYSVTILLFFIYTRLRLPLIPFVLILTGSYFHHNWQSLKHNKQTRYRHLTILAILFFLVNYNFFNLSPNYSQANYNLGLIYFDKPDQRELAGRYFQKAVNLDEQNFKAYFLLGLIAEDQDDLKSAENYYLKSVKITPNFLPPLARLGGIYQKTGRAEKARIAYRYLAEKQAGESPPDIPVK